MSQAFADSLVTEGNELLVNERFEDALIRFDKARQVFPLHPRAWRGVGQCLLSLGRPQEAARAFDHAIGLAPESATALWAGAVAHAELGNKVVSQSYLRRTLDLQPTWIEMARGIPQLAEFLQTSTRTAAALRAVFGAFSTRTYAHASDRARIIEVGRLVNQPKFGQWSFVTVGLSNHAWPDRGRPRIELVLASTIDSEICGTILANLAFHLGDTEYFPEPGVMVRDVVGGIGDGDLSLRLPHVYVIVPRSWEITMPLDLGPPPVTLAQVVPVSESEYALWREAPDKLEATLASRRVELANLRRAG